MDHIWTGAFAGSRFADVAAVLCLSYGVTTILKGVALAPAWITSRYGMHISLVALRRVMRKLLRTKRKQGLLHY